MGLFDWWRQRRDPRLAPLGAWRRDWTAAMDTLDCGAIPRLRQLLDSTILPADDLELEREMLEALAAVCELDARVHRAGLPVLETGHRAAAGDPCHFSAPASMPDDPGQPTGRLLLTARRAVFAGAGGASLPWHAVGAVRQVERDILLVERSHDRLLRFRCNTFAEAAAAAFLARHLARLR